MDLYSQQSGMILARTPALLSYAERVVGRLGIRELGANPNWVEGAAGEEKPTLVLIEESGLVKAAEICRKIRSAAPEVLLVILATGKRWAQNSAGLEAGADRYLTLPLAEEVGAAVLSALLRREVGGWEKGADLEPLGRDVLARLTPVERQILNHLARNQDRVCGYQELGLAAGKPGLKHASSVRGYITRIRARLGADAGILESVPRMGYRLGSRSGLSEVGRLS